MGHESRFCTTLPLGPLMTDMSLPLSTVGKGKHPGERGVKSLWSKKGAWVSIISLKKEFGDAMPLAEAWGLGYRLRAI